MPYKDYEKQKAKALENYYKNRKKRIIYQREYDKNHKLQKNEYERKKRRGIIYNRKKLIQHYSQKYHLPILIKKFQRCQFCSSTDKLEIHHKKYTKKLQDCLLLCLDCHKKIHRKI